LPPRMKPQPVGYSPPPMMTPPRGRRPPVLQADVRAGRSTSCDSRCPTPRGPDRNLGERIKDQFLGATAAVVVAPSIAPVICPGSGSLSEPWTVSTVGALPLCCWRWRAVRLLPHRPLIEALIEMAEQLALHRGLRHGVVAAA
jgi:hypothetical protein